MSADQKVAVLRRSADLGSLSMYAITYTVGGQVTGHGFARGDELDAWRTDLRAAGWTLDELADIAGAEAASGDGPLHAHELSAADAALIRMLTGAKFGPEAKVTLPSGRTVTGAEMARWVKPPSSEAAS